MSLVKIGLLGGIGLGLGLGLLFLLLPGSDSVDRMGEGIVAWLVKWFGLRQHAVAWTGVGALLVAGAFTVAAKAGWLQKLFGSLMSDLQHGRPLASHLDTAEKRLLEMRSARVNFGPKAYLTQADHWLSRWAGAPWSEAGLLRCFVWAAIYPVVIMLLFWSWKGTAELGGATVLPRDDGPVGERVFLAFLFGGGTLLMGLAMKVVGEWEPKIKEGIPDFLGRRLFGDGPDGISQSRAHAYISLFLSASLAALCVAGTIQDAGAPPVFRAWGSVMWLIVPVTVFTWRWMSFHPSIQSAWLCGMALVFGVNGAFDMDPLSQLLIGLAFAFIAMEGSRRVAPWAGAKIGFLSLLLLLSLWCIPQLSAWGLSRRSDALHVSGTPFFWLWLCWAVPLLNAVSDWLSVNVTRALIKNYRASARSSTSLSGWQFYSLDVGVCIGLIVVLYAAVLAAMVLMARWGWGVDVRAIVEEWHRAPFSAASQWMWLMALTNVVPTTIHLSLWATGAITGRNQALADDLLNAINVIRSLQISDRISQTTDQVMGKQHAEEFVYVLKIQPWLETLNVVCLTVAAGALLYWGVPAAAGVLLVLFPQL